jgi:hypothetical protein
MAVTTAVVIGNVCMSRRWKAEQVSYGIRNHLSPRFTLLMPLNLRNSFTYLVCPEQFSTVT